MPISIDEVPYRHERAASPRAETVRAGAVVRHEQRAANQAQVLKLTSPRTMSPSGRHILP